jgi:hypothetical protein
MVEGIRPANKAIQILFCIFSSIKQALIIPIKHLHSFTHTRHKLKQTAARPQFSTPKRLQIDDFHSLHHFCFSRFFPLRHRSADTKHKNMLRKKLSERAKIKSFYVMKKYFAR